MSGSVPVVSATAIPGLLLVDLPVHGDRRGWFKENWQRADAVAAGLPDFSPVQQNVSFNEGVGTTRGMHAEPWDKYVSVATGEVFAAWVDLRAGDGFGTVVSTRLGPGRAAFVPRGVANGFQTVLPGTAYTYLVTRHWSPDALDGYSYVNLADPALGIAWPVAPREAVLSDADRTHPPLREVVPLAPPRILVLGGGGQLGRGFARLALEDPRLEVVGRDTVDVTSAADRERLDLSAYACVVNAAAYTAVDAAQTPSGCQAAWAVNATAVSGWAAACGRAGVPLVHVSTDYVFGGGASGAASGLVEDAPVAPLSVYGASKAAGEAAVTAWPQHLVVRTSWLIGDGPNFVRTMLRLAEAGARPSVVDDQLGRLSFADELASAILHLIDVGAPGGIYHVQGAGPERSWCDVARAVFAAAGRDPGDVRAIPTSEYMAQHPGSAPRPVRSTLGMRRLLSTGFVPADQDAALGAYLAGLRARPGAARA